MIWEQDLDTFQEKSCSLGRWHFCPDFIGGTCLSLGDARYWPWEALFTQHPTCARIYVHSRWGLCKWSQGLLGWSCVLTLITGSWIPVSVG